MELFFWIDIEKFEVGIGMGEWGKPIASFILDRCAMCGKFHDITNPKLLDIDIFENTVDCTNVCDRCYETFNTSTNAPYY